MHSIESMKVIPLLLTLLYFPFAGSAQKTTFNSGVEHSGAMRNVMWKGELYATLKTDTLPDNRHLYGLGPVEGLKGEILILDGITYVSKIENDGSMKVNQEKQVGAPFFVYGRCDEWKQFPLTPSTVALADLEKLLDSISVTFTKPFLFRLTGQFPSAVIHVVNLPDGIKVTNPEMAHTNQSNFQLEKQEAEIVGFFSKEHSGVFIHHDSFVHCHLITSDKKQMGHLDALVIDPGLTTLWIASPAVNGK